MKSGISKILSGYKNSLEHARNTFEKEYNSRVKNALEFYDDFLNDLFIDFSKFKQASISRSRVIDNIKRWFKPKFTFAAIDGTCFKERLDPYLVFFSAAYAVRGHIKIDRPDNPINYERWGIEQDKSVVAYLPIPFANLSNLLDEEEQKYDDEMKINYSNIHLDLMSLAEIYLAYTIASGDSRPNLILLDQSISSAFNAQGVGRWQSSKTMSILNKNVHGLVIDEYDIRICYSHPYNKDLDIPSKKDFQIHNYLLRKLYESNYKLSYKELREILDNIGKNSDINSLEERLNRFVQNVDNKSKLFIFDHSNKELKLNGRYIKTWDTLRTFFISICNSILEVKEDKEDIGMIFSYVDQNGEIQKDWLKPGDIAFLKALGYRLLIEECWKNNTLLIGIAKDSSTAYFSKFYINILKNQQGGNIFEIYNFDLKNLPWTDRLLLESIALFKNEIEAPWSTIEFDSAFITLRKNVDKNIIYGSGMNNNIYYPERLFLRSLAQFYINRNKAIPSMGHAIFIDRVVLPNIEKIQRLFLGKNNNMDVLFFKDSTSENKLQEIIILILDILTKNLFPNVIGYPDPLHKADWGAKSLGDKIRPIILSSQSILKKNPLVYTLRQQRSMGGGR
ncbi:MAG: hypothetical protein ACFFG0_24645 [Candidatus Thorarchaeota archaeon]